MKLDAELRERLAAEADRLVPPDPPLKGLARRGRRRSRLRRTGVAMSVVALLGTAGVVGRIVLTDDPPPRLSAFSPLVGGAEPRPAQPPPDALGRTTPGLVDEEQTLEAAPEVRGAAPQAPVDIGVGPKVIKTARISVEVEDGDFQNSFSRAEGVADRYDGFITESGTSGEEARYGELTIRIPAPDFEAALANLKEIGVLRSEEIRGEDVTSDFVDLKARLRHWQAQEWAFLRLLDRANSIGEILTVNRQLEAVQLNIERVKGQLRLLRDQTSLGTITVSIHEEGVAPAEQESELAGAWGRAIESAEDVLVAIVVGLGYVLPILALLLLVWLALRAIRSRVAT
jgi:hypothetical protein